MATLGSNKEKFSETLFNDFRDFNVRISMVKPICSSFENKKIVFLNLKILEMGLLKILILVNGI
jgi:hypothetical protein